VSEEPPARRDATSGELALISALVTRCEHCSNDWLAGVKVSSMDDGGMGSLRLYPSGCKSDLERRFGASVAELAFKDRDGVKVLATMNFDQFGQAFEMDVWKTDFGKLIAMPDADTL
jgi:hypothetical protein